MAQISWIENADKSIEYCILKFNGTGDLKNAIHELIHLFSYETVTESISSIPVETIEEPAK